MTRKRVRYGSGHVPYILQRECTAICPTCRERMLLLAPEGTRGFSQAFPIFFVCFTDQIIAQAGQAGPLQIVADERR